MKGSRPYNIVILPPPAIRRRAIGVSKRLRSRGGRFVLDGKRHTPHITLYMVELPNKNISSVKDRLEIVAQSTTPWRLRSQQYRHNHEGYFDVAFARDARLMKLQRMIIRRINPLRNNLIRSKDRVRLPQLTARQQNNIRRYGYRGIGSLYTPHLTFTRLKKHQPTTIHQLTKKDFSFTVGTIGLYTLGSHGTCRRQIALSAIKK